MKRTILCLVINIICLLVLVGTTIFLIVYWNNIPDEIPTHYNTAGEVDNVGDKSAVIMLPIFNWIMFGIMSVVELCPGAWNTGVRVTPENSGRVYGILGRMFLLIKLELVLLLAFIMMSAIFNSNMPVIVLPVSLVVLPATIIIHLISLYKNR